MYKKGDKQLNDDCKIIQYHPKGGLKSEDTEEFFIAKINIPNHYPEQKISISCLLF